MSQIASEQALSGMRVLDFSQGVAGPHASMLLGLNGADVVKIEPPSGDWVRRLGDQAEGMSVLYLAFNRAKRSLVLDLKKSADLAVAADMAAQVDIIVESFRPGVMKGLGLDQDSIRPRNPNVIYCSISGFGSTGSAAARPGVDTLIQANSGFMMMNRSPDGVPRRLGLVWVDVATGLYAYQAIANAIIRRLRGGPGANLEITLAQSAAAMQAPKIMEFVQTQGIAPTSLYVPSGVFRTNDGYIVISGTRDEHFLGLCAAIDATQLACDARWPDAASRIRHAAQINALIEERLVQNDAAFWLERLTQAEVMAEAVLSYGQWLQQAHALESSAYAWCDDSAFGALPVPRVPGVLPGDDPAAAHQRPPRLGQHTQEILRSLGKKA